MISRAARLRAPLLRLSLALHLFGLVALALFPRQWIWVVCGLFADHLVLLLGSLLPRSTLVGPNLSRLPAGDGGSVVALTLDDGPDPDVTPAVLDLLERHGARASFFCIGRRVDEHPEVARSIAGRGHCVENHSHRHSPFFSLLGPRALAREIGRAQQAIASSTGRLPAYFRAPAGVRNPWLDWVLCGAGLDLVSWTRRAFDTVDGDPDRIVRRLLRDLAPGDVLALHDAGSARDANGNPVVLRVLPALLDELSRRGFRVQPLMPAATAGAAARHPASR